MKNGAHAEIWGELKEDVVIRGDEEGLICGLIHVLIDDPSEQLGQSKGGNPKPSYIPVLLRGKSIIKKHAHSLKRDQWVWLVGKFEVIENAFVAFEDFGFENISGVIISIHDKNRLIVLPEYTSAPSLMPESDIGDIHTDMVSSMSRSWASCFN